MKSGPARVPVRPSVPISTYLITFYVFLKSSGIVTGSNLTAADSRQVPDHVRADHNEEYPFLTIYLHNVIDLIEEALRVIVCQKIIAERSELLLKVDMHLNVCVVVPRCRRQFWVFFRVGIV